MNYVPQNIRYLRLKRGYSQDKLAQMLNKKSFTTIQKWETNKTEPSFSDVYRLAEIFNVNLDKFARTDLSVEQVDNTTEQEKTLLKDFRQLNDRGKEKAVSTVSEMTFNPLYNQNYLKVVAAHERTDIEVTEEMKENDNKLMDDF